MTGRLSFCLLLVILLGAAFGCGDITAGTTSQAISDLAIYPSSASLMVGSNESFSAIATYQDATTADVSPEWSVNNSIGTVASTGSAGIFTAAAEGTGYVIATYGGRTVAALVTVAAAE